MPERLVIAQTVTPGLLERAHRRQEPVVSGPPPPSPPEALEHLELGTGAGPPGQLPVWHLGEHLGEHGSLLPRGVVAHQHHWGIVRRRRAPSAIAPVARNPCVPAALPRSRRLRGGRGPAPLHEAGGQVPRPQVEGPEERDQGVAIQVAHQGAMPFEPQGCPPRRDHREARFLLTQQDEVPRCGLFLNAGRSGWAVCGWSGSALRARDVGREGRPPGVAQQARLGRVLTAMPWVGYRGGANAAEVQWARSQPPPAAPGVIQVQIVAVSAAGRRRGRPGPPWSLSSVQR